MRVISQDGKMDIPYERFVFSISKDNCVVASAQPVGSPRELYQGIMAKYSTEEKALKAMEMCRDSYAENELAGILCKGAGLIHEFKEDKIAKYVKMYNFQFPQDEDIV